MLNLAFPAALGFLAALGLVAFLYFLRMKFRRQPVSSTFLWDNLVKVNEGGARLQYRSLLLLVLQGLTVAALVLAVAGLEWVRSFPARPGTVYLLDTSASMRAREPATGKIRFDRAVEAVRADAATLPPGSPVAVFLVGDRTTALDWDLLSTARPGFGSFSEQTAAEALTAWVQTSPGPWSAVLVTDGGLDLGGSRLSRVFGGQLRSLDFAAPAPNLGITDVRIGALPAPGVRVTAFNGWGSERSVPFVLSREGREVTRWDQRMPPGSSTVTRAVPEAANPGAGLWRLAIDGHDALADDDAFDVEVAPPRPARVLYLGPPAPFLRAAFPGADFQEGLPTADRGPWDLAVVGGAELPPGWKGNLVTFSALPAGAPVFWGPEVSGTLSGAASHPLARWVPWSEVRADRAQGLVVGPGATVLATAGGWAVAAAWEAEGYRFLALGTDVFHSNLGLSAALPILMKNFRQAAVPQEANPLADSLRVGEGSDRAGTPDWHVVSTSAAGGPASLETVRHGGLWTLTARRPGTFVWTDGADSGTLTAHLPAAESDTAPRAVPGVGTASTPTDGTGNRLETTPLILWLTLLGLGLLAGEWRLWNGRFGARANGGLAAFRVAAAVAATLALAGFSPPLPTTQRSLVLQFDVSDSLGPALVAKQREAALALVDRLAPGDRVALVAFAATPRVLSGLLPRDQARKALETASLGTGREGTDATDLQAALSAGAQLLDGTQGSPSQYLFTDGRPNRGGDLDALTGRARAYPISAVPLGRPLTGVAAQGLDLPPAARPGEAVTARWAGWTDQDQSVTAALSVDGLPVQSRKVDLVSGMNSLSFVFDAGPTGTRTVEVAVADARTAGLLPVEGPAAVLVIRGTGTGAALAAALRTQGFAVIVRGPEGLPEDPAGYQGLVAVVLDNVPAPALSEVSQRRLKDWVAGGGGLLVVGGESSLGRGEYYDSLLEDLLPVQTDTRRRLQFTRSRILFVVDHSGSMTEEVGGITKLAAAVRGIEGSLGSLSPQDEVGFLEFDTEATWVLPFTRLTEKKTIAAALRGFNQGGGTDMAPALREVLAAFGHPGPMKRHVILLTDGQTSDQGFFRDFPREFKAAQVSLTVLGVGKEVNESLLSTLAKESDGVYYRVEGDQVPSALHKETVRVTRELVQEGRFLPRAVGSDAVQNLGAPPPPVLGYLVTRAKPMARVLWEADRLDGGRDPLVADIRYGAGRVAVVTSDSGARWLSLWSGLPVYNRFWGQTVRSLEAGPRDRNLRVDLKTSASVARVVVEALDDTGGLRTGADLVAALSDRRYALKETAPGRYEADVPLEGPGLQVISVADRNAAGGTWAWTWNPPGAEMTRGGADWAGLGRLVSTTGGLLQPSQSPAPPPEAWAWSPSDLRGWWLLVALALFVAELAVRSTSLGQLTQARAAFRVWWADQARPWVRPSRLPSVRNATEDERRTREAYRALAQRKSARNKTG